MEKNMSSRLLSYEIPVRFLEDEEYLRFNTKKVLPEKKTDRSAGYDVVAISEPEIHGERDPQTNLWNRIDYIQYRTGITIGPDGPDVLPEGYAHVLAFPRSSVSKYNLMLANSVGLIDNDYRGEILLRFKYIWQPEDYVISRDKIKDDGSFKLGVVGYMNWEKIYRVGDHICQLVGMPNSDMDFFESNLLTTTKRGSGGFQSTGK
jgi:dUTP pyrophosphatase